MRIHFLTLLFFSVVLLTSCNNSESTATNETKDSASTAQLKEENITYNGDNINMNGYIVYKDSGQEKRPAVLVVHEWWGLNDYSKRRARELADLGYVAMAVDMFGNGQTASSPDEAMKLAG